MAVWKCGGRHRTSESGEPFCDYEAPAPWRGRCPRCLGLYTPEKIGGEKKAQRATLASLANLKDPPRFSTGFAGFDQVLGGGLVPGMAVLISGQPGLGKSTVLLQVAGNVGASGKKVVYASGEQTVNDVGIIAKRVGAANEHVDVLGLEGDIYKITEECEQVGAKLLVLDSIQTAHASDAKGDEGSAEQVKAVANYLTWWCKKRSCATIVVAHINKDGDLAGPKAAEHLVDTVLELDPAREYLEDGSVKPGTESIVSLKSGKNRYGASEVTAYFRMTGEGLRPVKKKLSSSLVERPGYLRLADEEEV